MILRYHRVLKVPLITFLPEEKIGEKSIVLAAIVLIVAELLLIVFVLRKMYACFLFVVHQPEHCPL